jgi:hypothetical protein
VKKDEWPNLPAISVSIVISVGMFVSYYPSTSAFSHTTINLCLFITSIPIVTNHPDLTRAILFGFQSEKGAITTNPCNYRGRDT